MAWGIRLLTSCFIALQWYNPHLDFLHLRQRPSARGALYFYISLIAEISVCHSHSAWNTLLFADLITKSRSSSHHVWYCAYNSRLRSVSLTQVPAMVLSPAQAPPSILFPALVLPFLTRPHQSRSRTSSHLSPSPPNPSSRLKHQCLVSRL